MAEKGLFAGTVAAPSQRPGVSGQNPFAGRRDCPFFRSKNRREHRNRPFPAADPATPNAARARAKALQAGRCVGIALAGLAAAGVAIAVAAIVNIAGTVEGTRECHVTIASAAENVQWPVPCIHRIAFGASRLGETKTSSCR